MVNECRSSKGVINYPWNYKANLRLISSAYRHVGDNPKIGNADGGAVINFPCAGGRSEFLRGGTRFETIIDLGWAQVFCTPTFDPC